MSVSHFKEDWEVDFKHLELRVKQFGPAQKFVRWRRRYPLSSFHKYAHLVQASEDGAVFPTIFNSDLMPAVPGVPKKLELIGGWSIPKHSLERMIGDGYVLLGGGKLLVPEHKGIWDAINLRPSLFGFGVDLKKLFVRRK